MDAAFDVIAEGRGTQFDPDLVDLVLLPPVRESDRPRTRDARSDAAALPRRAPHTGAETCAGRQLPLAVGVTWIATGPNATRRVD